MKATRTYVETRTSWDLDDAQAELRYAPGRMKVTHVRRSITEYADASPLDAGESITDDEPQVETRWDFYGLKLTSTGKVSGASLVRRNVVDPTSPEAQAIIAACEGSA